MAKKNREDDGKRAVERVVPDTDSGEYGLGYVMNPNEDELSEVRKNSGYHFSADQLEHKSDPIDEAQ